MKTVVLVGGSFNPMHIGHLEIGNIAHETLDANEVWFMFSVNYQKDASTYASLEDRMAMGEILAQNYPDKPFVMSDLQDRLGFSKTIDFLTHLRTTSPDTRFISVIGADQLANLHTWSRYDELVENYPLLVLGRPPYTEQARTCKAAFEHAAMQVSTAADLKNNSPTGSQNNRGGWFILDNSELEISSSDIKKQLNAGVRTFDGPFQGVADYIWEHGLYGTGDQKPTTQPRTPA